MRLTPLCLFVAGLITALAVAPAWSQKEDPKDNPKDLPKEPQQQLSRGSTFAGKNLDDWIKELKDKDPAVQENAIATLKLYGSAAREAVPTLVKLFTGHRDTSLRVNLAMALGVIGFEGDDKEAGVSSLNRLLGDSQSIVRYQAAMALGRIGPDGHPAVPALINMLRSDASSWELRKASAFALGSIGVDRVSGPDPKIVSALAGAIIDHCFQVRLEVVLSLIVLGRPADKAQQLVVQKAAESRLKDPHPEVAIWADMLIMRIDKVYEANLDRIAKHLKNPMATVRSHVGRALGTIGPEAKSQLAKLTDAVQSENDPMALYWEVWAVAQLDAGRAGPRLIEALSRLAQSADPKVRQMANEAIALVNASVKAQAEAKEKEKEKDKDKDKDKKPAKK